MNTPDNHDNLPLNEDITPETTTDPPREDNFEPQKRQRRKHNNNVKLNRRSVMNYIAVLFAAAFCLLLLTFLMEQRESQSVIAGLKTTLTDLKQSNSAMQSVDALYRQNADLNEYVNELEAALVAIEEEQSALETELELSTTETQALTDSQAAMDWFWQINEAFVRGRNSTARNLIEEMETLDLVDALPTVSVTNNKRFSPADRYAEIYNILY